jgi:T4 bacteriophage base plate protein
MLPKLETPTYEITLPLSKKKIKYRPFLVKEQKILLMAMESKDTEEIHTTIKDILKACTLTEKIDVDVLPIIDVEYYFLMLRAKSVGEVVQSRYRCNNVVNDKPCNNVMEKDINLMDVKVQQKENISPEVQLTDKITVKLKYPEFGVIKDSLNYNTESEVTFNLIANSIEYIYDGEQFYYASESSHEELMEFVESMSQSQFEKIERFFNNLPKLKEKIQIKCSKCGYNHEINVEGLENFFG